MIETHYREITTVNAAPPMVVPIATPIAAGWFAEASVGPSIVGLNPTVSPSLSVGMTAGRWGWRWRAKNEWSPQLIGAWTPSGPVGRASLRYRSERIRDDTSRIGIFEFGVENVRTQWSQLDRVTTEETVNCYDYYENYPYSCVQTTERERSGWRWYYEPTISAGLGLTLRVGPGIFGVGMGATLSAPLSKDAEGTTRSVSEDYSSSSTGRLPFIEPFPVANPALSLSYTVHDTRTSFAFEVFFGNVWGVRLRVAARMDPTNTTADKGDQRGGPLAGRLHPSDVE